MQKLFSMGGADHALFFDINRFAVFRSEAAIKRLVIRAYWRNFICRKKIGDEHETFFSPGFDVCCVVAGCHSVHL